MSEPDAVDPIDPDDEQSAHTMTRSELINRLAERFPQLVAKDAEFAVRTILDAMANTLAAGKRIEIRGFGSFALSHRPPRVGRNPKSGETVMVPEKRVPHFKPGKDLRERVDARGTADNAQESAEVLVKSSTPVKSPPSSPHATDRLI